MHDEIKDEVAYDPVLESARSTLQQVKRRQAVTSAALLAQVLQIDYAKTEQRILCVDFHAGLDTLVVDQSKYGCIVTYAEPPQPDPHPRTSRTIAASGASAGNSERSENLRRTV